MALSLQVFIVPICRYEVGGGKAHLRRFFGTAFFVSKSGLFLTAAHVLRDAQADVAASGGLLGLCIKMAPQYLESGLTPILKHEFAPEPLDVAVGWVNFQPPQCVSLVSSPILLLEDVISLGYPDVARQPASDGFWMGIRAFKGHIQGIIADDIPDEKPPRRFETSFLISRGMSGAPLCVPGLTELDYQAVGVCVGSARSEIVDDEIVELLEGDKQYKETRLRIEQHGIAHDLRPLYDWRISFLSNVTLAEAARTHIPLMPSTNNGIT